VAGGLQLSIPWPSFFWLLMLALLGATVGWLLITSSLPMLPAAVSSLILLLQPAGALALADAVLGERPTPIQVAGALLVCLGVLAVTRKSARPRPADDFPAAAEVAQELPVRT
jgi:drug/metabolite transporter (DMT)-like permease